MKDTATVIPNSGPGVFNTGGSSADAEPYWQDCATPMRLQMGWVAAKADVYKWTGSSWAFCTSSDWIYGGYSQHVGPHFRRKAVAHGASIYFSYGATARAGVGSCGAGFYNVYGAAFELVNYTSGFQWKGGYIWSGYEYDTF